MRAHSAGRSHTHAACSVCRALERRTGGGGGGGGRTRDTAESGTPRHDGFAAFMRAQSGRISAAADPADARRQLSAEWLKLTVSERREWRRRDADHRERGKADGRSLGSTTSSRTGSSTPPRATRRKSPSSRSKHVRQLNRLMHRRPLSFPIFARSSVPSMLEIRATASRAEVVQWTLNLCAC